MASLLRWYVRLVDKHAMVTISSTTGALMCIGDAISQIWIEKKRRDYDFIRSFRFLSFGLFIGGPMFAVWYKGIDKVFKGSKFAAVKMVACDQGLFAPFFIPFFLVTMGLMRRDPVSQIQNHIKKDFVPIMVTNYKIWPAAQLVNFLFVPLHHRVLVVNCVSVGWNTYLAWKSESQTDEICFG